MSAQGATARTGAVASRRSSEARRADSRVPSARMVTALVGGLLVVLAAGFWGLVAPRGSGHDDHPHPGDALAFEGGTVVVDAIHDVDLSLPMTGPAMKMGPSQGVPEIPEGFRWVSVDFSVGSEADPYQIDPDRFTITLGPDMYGPVALDEGGSLLPGGAWLSRTFTYEVPEDAGQLEFWAPGARVPVMLTLGEAPEAHQH